jgi:hypothetical protein
MDYIKMFCATIFSILGIELITLSNIEIVVKILCQISVTIITCIYFYQKIKSIKR